MAVESFADMLAEAEKDGRLAIVGYVQDLSLNGNHGDMWTVDITVRTRITSQQVLELFGKIGDETATTSTQTSNG